jgi:hypothetical protein
MTTPCGDCYRWAYQYKKRHSDDKRIVLVHATVHPKWYPKRYGHAWIEIRGKLVKDWQTNGPHTGSKRPTPLKDFYKTMRPKGVTKYDDFDQITMTLAKSGMHYGPWRLDENANQATKKNRKDRVYDTEKRDYDETAEVEDEIAQGTRKKPRGDYKAYLKARRLADDERKERAHRDKLLAAARRETDKKRKAQARIRADQASDIVKSVTRERKLKFKQWRSTYSKEESVHSLLNALSALCEDSL